MEGVQLKPGEFSSGEMRVFAYLKQFQRMVYMSNIHVPVNIAKLQAEVHWGYHSFI